MNGENRGYGNSVEGDTMDAFDALPSDIRKWVRNLPFDVNCSTLPWNISAFPSFSEFVRNAELILQRKLTHDAIDVWQSTEYPVCHLSSLIESESKDTPMSPTSGEPSAPAAGKRRRATRPMRASRVLRTSTKKNLSRWK